MRDVRVREAAHLVHVGSPEVLTEGVAANAAFVCRRGDEAGIDHAGPRGSVSSAAGAI